MNLERQFIDSLRNKPVEEFNPVEFFKKASFARWVNLENIKLGDGSMPQMPSLPIKPAGTGPLAAPGFAPDKMTSAFGMKDPIASSASGQNINMRSHDNSAASSITTKAAPNPTGFQGSGVSR